MMIFHFFNNELHWIDHLFDIFILPILVTIGNYIIKNIRHKEIIGVYQGGTSIIEMDYPLIGGFKISCMEGSAVQWSGNWYKLSEDMTTLTGKYKWNQGRNTNMPDVGEHVLIFSEDQHTVDVSWRRLTGIEKSGKSNNWHKIKYRFRFMLR